MDEINWDDSITPKLAKADTRAKAFLFTAAKYHARRGQTYARENAPWKDRTSNARNGLVGQGFKDRNIFGFVIAGTVTYQPFLETRFSGRYAIILPTLKHEGPEFMKTASRMLEAVFGK